MIPNSPVIQGIIRLGSPVVTMVRGSVPVVHSPSVHYRVRLVCVSVDSLCHTVCVVYLRDFLSMLDPSDTSGHTVVRVLVLPS